MISDGLLAFHSEWGCWQPGRDKHFASLFLFLKVAWDELQVQMKCFRKREEPQSFTMRLHFLWCYCHSSGPIQQSWNWPLSWQTLLSAVKVVSSQCNYLISNSFLNAIENIAFLIYISYTISIPREELRLIPIINLLCLRRRGKRQKVIWFL